ncbi:helix-turn-helix domain-containing protein [Streptomyces sp. NPDC102441]|uniref:helix-turn-helix domain-containing protein n=1 Tax=Streptomyces sp. NPDC102441 TaxID=3366176 RepID=UPI00381339F9
MTKATRTPKNTDDAFSAPSFRYAYIRRRAREAGLTSTDLQHITGIPTASLEQLLIPATTSATRLLHLAQALDTTPQNLFAIPDTPDGAPYPLTEPPTKADDPTTLHAALLTGTGHRLLRTTVNDVLLWHPRRTEHAAIDLGKRLRSTPGPHRLVRTKEHLQLTSVPKLLTPHQTASLLRHNHRPTAFSPQEAAHLLAVLHHHLQGPRHGLTPAEDLSAHIERRLLDPTSDTQHHAPHPDVLYALDLPAAETTDPR